MSGGLRSYLPALRWSNRIMFACFDPVECNSSSTSSRLHACIPNIFRSHAGFQLHIWAALSRAWRHNDSDHANLAPRLLDCSMHGFCDLHAAARPASRRSLKDFSCLLHPLISSVSVSQQDCRDCLPQLLCACYAAENVA